MFRPQPFERFVLQIWSAVNRGTNPTHRLSFRANRIGRNSWSRRVYFRPSSAGAELRAGARPAGRRGFARRGCGSVSRSLRHDLDGSAGRSAVVALWRGRRARARGSPLGRSISGARQAPRRPRPRRSGSRARRRAVAASAVAAPASMGSTGGAADARLLRASAGAAVAAPRLIADRTVRHLPQPELRERRILWHFRHMRVRNTSLPSAS